MKLGKDAMYRQLDMPLEDALKFLRDSLVAFTKRTSSRRKAFFESAIRTEGTRTGGRLARGAALPTADRIAGAPRGVRSLAPLMAGALGVEPRFIGTAGEIRESRYEDDLRSTRGCLLEAGARWTTPFPAATRPCSSPPTARSPRTTLPAALRNRPDARVLWLDAHGDYNTPETSGSGYLGGMCLAAATGEWDAGLGGRARGARGARRGPRPRSGRARPA